MRGKRRGNIGCSQRVYDAELSVLAWGVSRGGRDPGRVRDRLLRLQPLAACDDYADPLQSACRWMALGVAVDPHSAVAFLRVTPADGVRQRVSRRIPEGCREVLGMMTELFLILLGLVVLSV